MKLLKIINLLFMLVITVGTSTAQNTNAKIPIKDLSAQRLEVGQAFAQKHSGGQIILHYMGADKATMKLVYQALSKAKSEGAPVGGMVISAPNPDFQNGTECYHFYLQGICLEEEPIDGLLKPEWLVYKMVKSAEEIFFKSRSEGQ